MANKSVRKLASASDQISGLKTSRYEKASVAYGVIEQGAISWNDVLVFDDINSKDIIEAKITAHTQTPSSVEVLPGTNLENPLSLAITGATPSKISYVIHYIRGTGAVGNGNNDPAGEGELLRVVVVND